MTFAGSSKHCTDPLKSWGKKKKPGGIFSLSIASYFDLNGLGRVTQGIGGGRERSRPGTQLEGLGGSRGF